MNDFVRFLAHGELVSWLTRVAESRRVLAPRKEGTAVVFKPWTAADGEPLTDKATVSPKGALIPSSETLFTIKSTKDPENLASQSLELKETIAAEPTVVFAGRACDARGMLWLTHPYSKGLYKDPYFMARREATVIITRTCDMPAATCFCNWSGGSPASPEGSDILMTRIEDGWLLEDISGRGRDLISDLPDGAAYVEAAEAARQKAEAMLPPPPANLADAQKRLAERFTDDAFWLEHTSKCISCGACTYMCPTCQCFNITDEGDPATDEGGRRVRSWDYCMSPLFTREASGHNPRTAKAARMKNRVSHKYCYSPEYAGQFSCTGCGRCIVRCPVSLDIREIVLRAIEKE